MGANDRAAAAPRRLRGLPLDHAALAPGAPDHAGRAVRNVENGRRCRGHARGLLHRRTALGDRRPRDRLGAGGSAHRRASVPAGVLQDRAVAAGVRHGAVARGERDGADGHSRARGRRAEQRTVVARFATGRKSRCRSGDLWARLRRAAPGAAQGVPRPRHGCARGIGGTRVSDARRLLVVSYYFGPDGSVGGLRWAGITKYLARLGWEVRVVTAAPLGANGEPGGASVEWCPRFPTLLDGSRRLRRLTLGPSRGWSRNGSGAAAGEEFRGLLRGLRREAVALLAFPDEGRG